jgi:hypothetical protein
MEKSIDRFVAFNFLGLINEIFQNWLGKRSYFILTPDSMKDLRMNLVGAALFILTACARIVWMRRKANVYF